LANDVIDFIHELVWDHVPEHVKTATRIALLDLLGVAASGTATTLAKIVANHAVSQFGSCRRNVNRLCRCSRWFQTNERPCRLRGITCSARLCRSGRSGHHTSGAWIALAAAAIGARSLGLSGHQTREALGIAEYHGPRSQMMRCIDHPTMLKDGSGWGSMAGCSAALLAQDGFTGSPALTVEGDDVKHIWSDLGSRWTITEQYTKAYPVCRWAQPAIAGVLEINKKHNFKAEQIRRVEVGTFHESKRLSVSEPSTTEQAQYSLPFPTAVAIVHNDVAVEHIDGAGLQNKQVLEISNMVEIVEVEEYNQCFPALRKSHVVIELDNGDLLESGTVEAAGDPEVPFSKQVLETKFMRFAGKPLGIPRATALKESVLGLGVGNNLQALESFIYQPASLPGS